MHTAHQYDNLLKVEIDEMVYQKVMHWVNKSEFEVSGLGKVVIDPERPNILQVVDAMLLDQENGTSSTDLKPESICKAMYELKDTPGELKWWWHKLN